MADTVRAKDTVGGIPMKVKDRTGTSTAHAFFMAEDPAVTATVTSVNDSAAVQDLKVANANRCGFIIYNNSSSRLYIKFGSGATVTDFTDRIEAFERWVMPKPIYTGVVTGIWDADSSGAALITELI